MLPCDVSGVLHLHAERVRPNSGACLLATQEAVPERFVGGIRFSQGAGKHRHHPGRIRERHHGGRTGGTACEPPWKPVPTPAQGGRGGATREGFQVDEPVESGRPPGPLRRENRSGTGRSSHYSSDSVGLTGPVPSHLMSSSRFGLNRAYRMPPSLSTVTSS